MQILIAEDNAVCTRLLAHLLKPLGDCTIVSSGEEAVEFIGSSLEEGRCMELICLSVKMPGIDGRDALKRIRALESMHNVEDGRRSKVMFTTSVPEDHKENEGVRNMYQAYLAKPYSKTDLYQALSSMGIQHPNAF